jgi:sodium/potassium-transporting ATPase subunit alpha
MNVFRVSIEEALASLGSGPKGLSAAEAARRLREFGPNRIERVRGESVLHRLLKSFTHFFAILLWVAAGVALFAAWSQPGQGMGTLAVAIVGVILINGLFGFWQEYKAERTLAALARLLPVVVKTVRDGTVALIPSEEVVPGDLLVLAQGDNIPADCRLIEAFGVRVNTATVTGESLPSSRSADPTDAADAVESANVLLAGTEIIAGEAKAVVFATGSRSEFGRIAHLVQSVPARRSLFMREIARVSHIVAVLATVLGVAFFLIGIQVGLPLWQSFLFAIGIIVANVPEGLLPTVTLSLALGAQRMAARKVLIRHLPAVETLGSADVICTDKTGTLTENRMSLKLLVLARVLAAATPATLAPDRYPADRRFVEVARWCQSLQPAKDQPEGWLGDPMEIALVKLTVPLLPVDEERPRLGEIAFDTDRKRISTIHRTPAGPVLYTKGALETVLPRCSKLAVAAGDEPLDGERLQRIRAAEADLTDRGLRVLALAWRALPSEDPLPTDEHDLTFLGLVGFEDPPRAGVAEAVATARAAGIKVIVTTGDHPHTALALARQVGLIGGEDPVVITGTRLRHLSDIQLQLALDAPEVIFARLAADQKLRIVRSLKAKGHIVAVTGDGVNDAPALKEADIGVAMGRSGSDVAREAADLVLEDDHFGSIVDAIEEGRAVFDNVRKFMTYILTSNIPEVVPYLAFALLGIPLPLTIIQILAVDLGTDMLPALALGAERPHPEVMRQPPRARSQRLLDAPLLLRAYLFLGLFQALAAMAAYAFVLSSGGWQWGQVLAMDDPLYLRATTACLAAIVVAQVVNVFLCRSERDTVFGENPFSNRMILWGVASEIILILVIVYTPIGHAVFGTAPLPFPVWLFMLPFALLMLLAEELRKLIVRRAAVKDRLAG